MKNYKGIWDNLGETYKGATFFVCCGGEEDQIRSNGTLTAAFLKEVLQIGPADRVLEIGCGIGRVGRELAQYCDEWHGADISGKMVAYARERTTDIPNIQVHELPQSDLSIFADNSFDCVYSTIVFMHLDKLEMFTYMQEACRVLAPGGRAYFDTFNLLGSQGWQAFRNILESFPEGTRPGHVSQFSTPQEVAKFMEEAGFEEVHVDGDTDAQLVLALGRKPMKEGVKRAHVARLRDSISNDPSGSFGPVLDNVSHLDTTAYRLFLETEKLNKTVFSKTEYIAELQQEIERLHESIAIKNEYIGKVEQALKMKNRHIERIERLVRKHAKQLSRLPVRLLLRLQKMFARRQQS